MPFPFEVPFEQVRADIDQYVDAVFSVLQSDFLTLPRGPDFIEYPTFELGYEALKKATGAFRDLSASRVLATVYGLPISLVVLRTMLGFTPPELAYVTTQRTGVEVDQGAARAIDKRIRSAPVTPLRRGSALTQQRISAMVCTACELLTEGAPESADGVLHRLEKADTISGAVSLRALAEIGVPYAMLLYERFLGRPFAGHRDAVSGLVGDVLEAAIEDAMHRHGISFRKTKRAERITGFDQAPDFIVPDEYNPQVVIEAKITEDDGTARDKVTRVQHLAAISMSGRRSNQTPRFQVVACIAGRGFKVRREDMRKLLLATRGKVFTVANIAHLVEHTRLSEFTSR